MNESPEYQSSVIQSHWGIENSLHWVLDVTFNEYKSRIRKGNDPEDMALVGNIALNLIRQNQDSKTSLKRRKRRAMYSDQYLKDILKIKF